MRLKGVVFSKLLIFEVLDLFQFLADFYCIFNYYFLFKLRKNGVFNSTEPAKLTWHVELTWHAGLTDVARGIRADATRHARPRGRAA